MQHFIQISHMIFFDHCQHMIKYDLGKKKTPHLREKYLVQSYLKAARNEVENASMAQRSAHRCSRKWRPDLIASVAEHKRRASSRSLRPKLASPDPYFSPHCHFSSNYPLRGVLAISTSVRVRPPFIFFFCRCDCSGCLPGRVCGLRFQSIFVRF